MSGFNLSALAVRERSVTLFLIVVVTLAGIFAFLRLGRAEDPSFTIKQVTVVTAWPGATAQEMQDLVAEPLEKRMQELPWYDRSETFTRPGLAFSVLTLRDDTPPAEVPDQFYQARKKIADESINLPRGVLSPIVNDEFSDVVFALYALKSPREPQRALVRDAEVLRQRLLKVPGVKKVNIVGEQAERIFVDFSQTRLATLGISVRDVFVALQRQNLVTPAGSIETSGPRIFIRLDSTLDDLQRIRDVPIVARDGRLKLSDLAEVHRGTEDPATFMIRFQGQAALLLAVVMRDGWNGLVLGKALEREAAAISTDLPLGQRFDKVTDQAVNIREAVDEFMLKFFVALTVVMIVSLVSLGWRVGIVVAAAVPLTLGSVFVIMLATGRDFDRVTLGALILALGLLVDDAIIAIEMMVVKMTEGYDRIAASSYAWSHTAAPMLAGTLVTAIGLMPVGFAKSSAGEYAGNIFWVVALSLIASWIVAVAFTPYLGVRLLPDIAPIPGGHAAIYDTARYRKARRVIRWSVRNKGIVAASVVIAFALAVVGMAGVKQQFFPTSDRPEVLVEVQMPQGTGIGVTDAATRKIEDWLGEQPEAKAVTAYVGQGAPRFFLPISPELPNPSFAKIVVLTPTVESREALKARLRRAVADGLAPGAQVRVTQLVFGPPSPYPVAFRVMGPEPATLRAIAAEVRDAMQSNGNLRTINADWGERVPAAHLIMDEDRIRSFGLDRSEVADQLQFLLTGAPLTQVREGIRTVELTGRSAGPDRLDPAQLGRFTLVGRAGQRIPFDQLGYVEIRMEDPILRRRDRTPTITVRGDIDESLQPPEVSKQILAAIEPVIRRLPPGYRIETAGSIEEAAKANAELAKVFPLMILLMLTVIMVQVRSFPATAMVMLTAPLGLIGVVPVLLVFHQPFGFNAILGMIGLAGIIMRNTLILIGQIQTNRDDGLSPFDAVVEATLQRARPVLLTALAAVLAFIPLTTSVFWGALAYTLIGGTAVGTVLTLIFLPALYALWFRVRPPAATVPRPTRESVREVTA